MKLLLVWELGGEAFPSFGADLDILILQTKVDQVLQQSEWAFLLNIMELEVIVATLGDGLDLGVGRVDFKVNVGMET